MQYAQKDKQILALLVYLCRRSGWSGYHAEKVPAQVIWTYLIDCKVAAAFNGQELGRIDIAISGV